MNTLPIFVPLLFVLTTLLTLGFFMAAVRVNNPFRTFAIVLFICIDWLLLNGWLAWRNFYSETTGLPPRLALAVLPPLILIGILFITRTGRKFIDSLPDRMLVLLHTVRIFVEMILYWLFLYQMIPRLMTFEGRNLDILAGLSAPVVFYFGYVRKALSKKFLTGWNILCLLLLMNIVINALLSAPFRFQQFAFDQPNTAILYFPFVWLPCFIVPVVLFSHLVLLRKLRKND